MRHSGSVWFGTSKTRSAFISYPEKIFGYYRDIFLLIIIRQFLSFAIASRGPAGSKSTYRVVILTLFLMLISHSFCSRKPRRWFMNGLSIFLRY